MRVRYAFSAAAALLIAGPPVRAQTGAPSAAPARPRLSSDADSNDARAYFAIGLEKVQREPREAAAAFYWAGRLDPVSPQILYARNVALMLSNLPRLERRMRGDTTAALMAELRSIDSLRLRAMMHDPFLHRGLDELLLTAAFRTEVRRRGPRNMRNMSDEELAGGFELFLAGADPYMAGVLVASRGHFEAALQYWNSMLEEGRRKDHLHAERARAFFLLGRLDSARAAMTEALAVARGDDSSVTGPFYESKASWEYSLARVEEELGDTAAARAAYQRALVEDLGYYPAHVRLALLALGSGDSASAVVELERSLIVHDDYFARATLGALLARRGRRTEAVSQLQGAIALEPYAAAPRVLLATILDQTGDLEGAFRTYHEFLARAPRDDPNRTAVERRVAYLRQTGLR